MQIFDIQIYVCIFSVLPPEPGKQYRVLPTQYNTINPYMPSAFPTGFQNKRLHFFPNMTYSLLQDT